MGWGLAKGQATCPRCTNTEGKVIKYREWAVCVCVLGGGGVNLPPPPFSMVIA